MSPAYNIRLHVAYMSKCSKLNCPKLKPPWLKSQLKSPRRKSFRLKLPQQNGVKKIGRMTRPIARPMTRPMTRPIISFTPFKFLYRSLLMSSVERAWLIRLN